MREAIQKILDSEAAWFIGLLTAVLAAVVSYGLVSQARADLWISILTFALPVVLPIVQAIATRLKVYSKNTTQELADQATFQPAGSKVDIGKPPDASPPLTPQG